MIKNNYLRVIRGHGLSDLIDLALARVKRRIGPVALAAHDILGGDAGAGHQQLDFREAFSVVIVAEIQRDQHRIGAAAAGTAAATKTVKHP